jgi:hypothetical protein
MVCSNEPSSGDAPAVSIPALTAAVPSTALPAKASDLCGDRLSTVNGPATRIFFASSYGLSYSTS